MTVSLGDLAATVPVILSVVGARPQFIKAAPVSRAIASRRMREVLVHTGQHFDPGMSDVFFADLGIPTPSYSLGIHSLGHGAMTGRMIERLEAVMLDEKPDLVVAYGDTNSTVAGALAAAKLNIPIAHVEAGLRSFNRRMPEEINRLVTDHLSTLLLCPTQAAVSHLAAEGITRGVHAVGDVMFDVALASTPVAEQRSKILETLDLAPRGYAVATVHRSENTDDRRRLEAIMAWLEDGAHQTPIVLPLHPRTRQQLARWNITPTNVRLIEPLGYLDMTRLVHHATAVFTDSGGLQKEAYFHRVPCVTLRDETEWTETIDAGWNRLWTVADYRARRDIADFGTGNAAQVIAELLAGAV